MARAFVTALTHEDESTRQRADRRAADWSRVLDGIARGRLRIGSRQPSADLPVWVSPKVLRGGFATGEAQNGGELADDEIAVAGRTGVPADRRKIFAYYLTEEGLAELDLMLASGAYEVRAPEDAALLALAWLVSTGHHVEAADLARELEPCADRVRFAPRQADTLPRDRSLVFRKTAAETSAHLNSRRDRAQIAVMRETLDVWNPYADELLSHWLETEEAGRIASRFPSGWASRGRQLLSRYSELAGRHVLATKHRRPKENAAILRLALEQHLAKDRLDSKQLGLLQTAVDSMVRKRGRPGSSAHAKVREEQRRNASIPTHKDLALLVIRRLAEAPPNLGLDDPRAYVGPVAAEETELAPSLVVGAEIPAAIVATVDRAWRATPESLISAGIVRSAEVLAGLVPSLAAAIVSGRYRDEALATLMAANYEAFRRRRSLLLLNLEQQVGLDELPWVEAIEKVEDIGSDGDEALATLARVTELAITAFPGTIMPNPLVSEMQTLSREAGLDIPLVEEIASDIFMGAFSSKFVLAAKLAGSVVGSSLYSRYYAIDYAQIGAISDIDRHDANGAATSSAFNELCRRRAGVGEARSSVAANGMVIEQAQILTTHNLAALTGPFAPGDRFSLVWLDLADRAFERSLSWLDRLAGKTHPLRAIKNSAFAWRQMLYFLAQSNPGEQKLFVVDAREKAASSSDLTATRVAPALDGLEHVIDGGAFDPVGSSKAGRRFLGWSTGGHWMLTA